MVAKVHKVLQGPPMRAIHLPVSNYRRFEVSEIERMAREMRSHLPPANEGPVIEESRPEFKPPMD